MNFFRVVSANSRVLLLEVDVYSYWSNVIQRILLVEGQSESSFGIDLWSIYMPLYSLGIILAWAQRVR